MTLEFRRIIQNMTMTTGSPRLKKGPHGYLVIAATGKKITSRMVKNASEDKASGNLSTHCPDIRVTMRKGATTAMPAHSLATVRRTEKLDVRISRAAKAKLQAAAAASHRSMSDFVLDSALSKAEETLAERRIFSLNAENWAAFQAALDAPPRPLPKLKALLEKPGFFESGSPR